MSRLSVTARRSAMYAFLPRRRTFVYVMSQAIFTYCLTINKLGHPDIVAKTRIALTPLNIPGFLNDVIQISAPIINEQSIYYIHRPNGDAMKLDIHMPKLRKILNERDVNPIVSRYINNVKPIITQSNNYNVFSVKIRNSVSDNDVFDKKVKGMDENDFMIGPLTEEDNGNWVLSILTKDFQDNWIELFQVITVTITEYVPLTPWKPTLNLGETFNLSFEFPIANLETCELVAPRSTFDRFYDRVQINMNNCGFRVPNVTYQDSGVWRIIAVGKIVYEGEVLLNVNRITDNISLSPNKTSSPYVVKVFNFYY